MAGGVSGGSRQIVGTTWAASAGTLPTMPKPFHVEPAKPGGLDRLRELAREATREQREAVAWLICQREPLAVLIRFLEGRRQ